MSDPNPFNHHLVTAFENYPNNVVEEHSNTSHFTTRTATAPNSTQQQTYLTAVDDMSVTDYRVAGPLLFDTPTYDASFHRLRSYIAHTTSSAAIVLLYNVSPTTINNGDAWFTGPGLRWERSDFANEIFLDQYDTTKPYDELAVQSDSNGSLSPGFEHGFLRGSVTQGGGTDTGAVESTTGDLEVLSTSSTALSQTGRYLGLLYIEDRSSQTIEQINTSVSGGRQIDRVLTEPRFPHGSTSLSDSAQID